MGWIDLEAAGVDDQVVISYLLVLYVLETSGLDGQVLVCYLLSSDGLQAAGVKQKAMGSDLVIEEAGGQHSILFCEL